MNTTQLQEVCRATVPASFNPLVCLAVTLTYELCSFCFKVVRYQVQHDTVQLTIVPKQRK